MGEGHVARRTGEFLIQAILLLALLAVVFPGFFLRGELITAGDLLLKTARAALIDSAGNVLTGYNVVDQTATIIPTGIAATLGAGNSAAVVPNPSTGAAALHLQLAQPAGLELTVTDMTGRKVWQQPVQAASGASSLQLPVELDLTLAVLA